MHTLWKGPMQVVDNDLDEYTLLDLITNRKKRYRVLNIKQFEFDPTKVNPTDIARVIYRRYPSNGREHPSGGNIKISRQAAKLSPRQKNLGTVEIHA